MLLAAIIFIAVFLLIMFEVFDKAVLASLGAILMVFFGVIDFETALASIEFETIILLMSMMLLVEVSRESGIFSWLTVKMAKGSRGNPFFIFILFSLVTAFISAFLDNVTTIVLMVPITIALVKGMGRDPKLYILAEIFFSNIGGTLTMIGDPPNIIIGGVTKLPFFDFIKNLWIPVSVSMILIMSIFVAINWKKHFKPISGSLRKLFLSHMLIQKISYKFLNAELGKAFMVKSVFVILLTTIGFFMQSVFDINVGVIAFAGAILLLLIASKEVKFEHSLRNVEWSTLLFFAGLFVMVGAVEHVGLLKELSHYIVEASDGGYLNLLLMILWIVGITSMVLNNIPFITLMIPIIFDIQAELPAGLDHDLLWWALALGACFGGNGTIIGASANVIGVDLAKKDGVDISFLTFFKYGFPITIVSLAVSSVYLMYRVNL